MHGQAYLRRPTHHSTRPARKAAQADEFTLGHTQMASTRPHATVILRCKNCGTDRFKITRGFCTRCSYCIGKIAKLKKADPDIPSSLVGAIPKGGVGASFPPGSSIAQVHGYGPGYWVDQFEKDRTKMIREFKSRLRYLKETEQRLRGEKPISYLHISGLFRQLAHWSGCPRRKKILGGMSVSLMESFTSEQRLLLYRWLIDVSESTSRRWRSFHASYR